jgi:hypothetical protein
MNFLLWRLHRNQVYLALGLLAGLTILLLITGWVMADDYRDFLASCGSQPDCTTQLFRGDGAILDLVNFTIVVPLLLGVFWGVPMMAKECEEGTLNLAWTQGVSRRHWLRANILWVLLAAALWGGAMAALVSWWRTPENALDTRFTAFDIQGIVPVAYALAAVALGIAVGTFVRRVLPAIAITITVFVAIRVAVGVYLRPHFMTAVTKLFPLGPTANAPNGAWTLSSSILGPHGVNLGAAAFSVTAVPAACRRIGLSGQGINGRCMAAHGFHQIVVYQPASRFWAFQGIEAGIFVVLAIGMLALASRRVLSRDA